VEKRATFSVAIAGVPAAAGALFAALCAQFTVVAVIASLLVPLEVFIFGTSQAHAASCRQLERQLVSLNRSSGSNRFTRAAREQQRELTKAKRIARSRGCGPRNSGGACRARLDLVQRMERNLASLQRQARSGGNRNAILKVQRQMRQQRCGATITQVKPRGKSLTEQIFGTREVNERNNRNTRSSNVTPRRGSTYRTMCVRTCDGYYFPISFSTTKSYFPSDADACASRCPATNTELFFHAMPTGAPEEMVSYSSGDAYSGKPFAFKFRDEKVENCSCGAASQSQLVAIAGENQSLIPDDRIKDFPNGTSANQYAVPPIPLGKEMTFVQPNWRPLVAASPEDRSNLLGKLTLASASAKLSDPKDTGDTNIASSDAVEPTIRVVGPQFFPDE
jgi:hypothetical protein